MRHLPRPASLVMGRGTQPSRSTSIASRRPQHQLSWSEISTIGMTPLILCNDRLTVVGSSRFSLLTAINYIDFWWTANHFLTRAQRASPAMNATSKFHSLPLVEPCTSSRTYFSVKTFARSMTFRGAPIFKRMNGSRVGRGESLRRARCFPLRYFWANSNEQVPSASPG